MKYLLDSNAWIGHLRQNCPEITLRLGQVRSFDVALCSVVLGELRYGAERSAVSHRVANLDLIARLRSEFASLPFDDDAAEHYGILRAALASTGTLIGSNDLMIAAIAISHGLTLVTHNTAEFSRVPGLTMEDWQAS